MKMNRKTKKIASNFVCIVTALSLVFLQTPVSYATAGADEAAQAVASQAEKASQVDELAVQAADDDGQAAEETSKAEAAKAEPAGGADAKATDAADAKKAADAEQAKGDAADKATKAGEDAKPAAEAKPETADGAAKATDAKSDDAKAAGEGETADAAKDASGKEEPKDAAVGDKGKADAGDAAKESASEEDAGKDTAADAKSEAAKDDADAAKGEKAEKPATQRVYTYEDAQLKVTATLDKASAISDNAELKVTAITAKSEDYNYDAYLAALNEDADEEDAFTADNTLLYDVAFLVKDDDGKVVEVQPESGSVKVQFEFKKDQLAKQLDAQEADDVQVVHLPLKDSAKADTTAEATDIAATDVKVEKLDADVNVEDGTLSLKAQEFSAFAVVTLEKGSSDAVTLKFETTEGDAVSGAVPEDYYALASFTVDGVEYANLKKIDSDVLVNGVTYNQQGDNNWYTFVKPSDTNVHFSGHLGSTTNLSVRVVKLAWGGTIDYSTVAWNASNLVDIGPGDSLGQYFVAEFKESDDGKVKTVTLTEPKTAKVNLAFVDSAGEEIAPQLQGKNLYLFAALHFNDGKTGDLYYRTRIEPTDSTTVYSIEQFTDGNGNNPAKLVDGRTFEAFIVTDQTGEPSLNDCLRAFKNQSTKTSGNVTLYDGTINDVIAGQSATYLVDNVAGSANAPANITLTKAPSVDTTISVFDRDGSTSYTVQDADISGYKFYAVAALVNKGEDKNSTPTAWAIVPVDFSGKTSVDLSFVDFYKYDEDGASTSETIAYDPSKYDVGGQRGISIFRTTSNDAVSTYKQLMDMVDAGTISDQPVDGFEWKGNTSLVENPSSIMLKRSYEKVLQVKLDFNDEGKILSDSDNLYLFIKVKHQSGADSYFFQGITSAEAGDITIRVPNWQDNNGDAKDDKFTGNESTIEVKLLKGKQGLNMNNAISGTDCSVVTEGSVAEGYTVHYDFTSDPKDAEENTVDSERTTYYTKVIELTKVNAANDYTFRSILGPAIGYGITADRLEQGSSDFQSNFAVNNYHDNGIGINPDLSGGSSGALAIGNYVTYNSDAGTVASIDPDGKVFIGQSHSGDLLLYTDSADRVRDARDWVYTIVYSPDEVAEKIVEPSIAHMQKISAELAAHSANITPSKTTDKVTIDTTDYPDDATIYVDADALDAEYGSFSGGTTLNIVKKENQTIVFNFKGMETVNVGQYVVTIYDSDGNVKWDEKNSEPNTGNAHGDANHQNTLVDELCKTIIWNLASATDVTIEQTAGTFLLPKSNSKTLVEKTSTGWIVSDGYVYNKGEWHFAWADLNQVDVAELNASKTIGGKVPTGTQKFEFSFEHWNKANNDWVLLKDVKNDGSSVTWRTVNESDGKSELNNGWNVYKISEKRKSEGTLGEFALDENTYYAVVKYTTTENASGTTAIASLPVYYKTFNSAAFDANAESATAFMSGAVSSITFVNEEEKGDLELKKTVTGSEDTSTKFTFEIKVVQPAPTDTDENATKALSGMYKAEVATEGSTGNLETVNVEFANGYGYIELTAGQTATIKGLPAGSTYTVKETKVGGKTLPSGGSVDQWSVKSVSVDEQNASGVIGSGTIVKDKTAKVGFINAYADNTKGSLRIAKNATVNGEDPTDANKSAASGTFTFKVKGPGPEGQEQTVTITLENGESSTATLENLTPGEYTVAEVTDDLPNNVTLAKGVKNPQTVTVVAGDETGIPTAEFTNNFTFTEYSAEGSVAIGGYKEIVDADGDKSEERTISFSLYDADDVTVADGVARVKDGATPIDSKSISMKDGENAIFTFDDISYTLAELGEDGYEADSATWTRNYVVLEDDATATYGDLMPNNQFFQITVTIKDKGDGTLEANANPASTGVQFVNNEKGKTSISVSGGKEMTGRNLTSDDVFQFELSAEPATAPMPEGAQDGKLLVENTSGTISFGSITYGAEDIGNTYTYQVKETDAKTRPDVTNDSSVKTFRVVVSESAGEIVATVSKQDDGSWTEISAGDLGDFLTFENAYSSTADVTFGGTKTLEGASMDEGQFTFEVKEDGAKDPVATGTAAAATAGVPSAITFGKITYTQDDLKNADGSYATERTHTYTVTENQEALKDGVTQTGTTSYTVTVKVSIGADGKLQAEPSSNYQSLAFTNAYKATGEAVISGKKTLDGAAPSAGSFSFELLDSTGARIGEPVTNDGEGNFQFPAISYEKTTTDFQTTYEYTVREVNGGSVVNGIQFDSTVAAVTVELADDGKGNLTPSYSYKSGDAAMNSLAFENESLEGEAVIAAQKTLTGKDLTAGDFEFELKANDHAPMPSGSTGNTLVKPIDGDGLASFGTIVYGKPGAYTYTLKEVVPQDAENNVYEGVTYDSTEKTVTVVVSGTEVENGKLKTSVTYSGDSNKFTNAYAADGSFTITGVTKALTGRAAGENETFTFVVKETDAGGNVLAGKEQVATGTVSGTGVVTFDPISFRLDKDVNETGKHYYKVSEVGTDGGGLSYDKTSATFDVTVADDGKGNLTVDGTKDARVNLNKTFTNQYKANGKVQLQATKQMQGRSLIAEDEGKFTFELSGPKLGTDGTNGTITATNGEGGVATFAEIAFAEEDLKNGSSYLDSKDFTYKIREVVPDDADKVKGVTYDTSEKTVTVTVSDPNHDGKLVVTPAYPEGGATFTNTYDAKGSVTLEGTKSITGRSFKTGDSATMQIEAVTQGAPMPKVDGQMQDIVTVAPTSGKSAAFSFGEIVYSLSDIPEGKTSETFTYKVTESAYTMQGVDQKDSTEYTVNVTISDKGDGTLNVVASDNATGLSFTNDYAASGSLTLGGTKTIDKREIASDDTFKFEVKEGDKVVSRGVAEGASNIIYEAINYTLADVGEHEYVASETQCDAAGVSKTNATCTLKVKVSDNGNGTLKVETLKGDPENLSFTNAYSATGELKLSGKKAIENKPANASLAGYTFTVKEGDTTVATGESDANGNITFDKIIYTEADAGTHTYVVAEDGAGTAKDGVTNTQDTVTVVVDVADDGRGQMTATTAETSPAKIDAVNFTNTYAATGSITFEGVKKLENATLTEGQFGFSVSEGNTVLARVTHDADGKIAYPTINYMLDDVGTHTYTVEETSEGGNGITVDNTTHTVTVKVSDNGDGTLKVEPSDNYTKLDFTNSYDASGTATLEVAKALATGDEWPEGKSAEFTLAAQTEGAPMPAEDGAKVSLSKAGTASFGTITYPLGSAGKSYEYTITETAWTGWDASANGVVNVTVEVGKDTGTGKLATTVTYKPGDFTITNTMKRTSASVKKVWDDAENQDGKRPASLTVALKADGETVKTVELSDANKWTATVDDLPEYAGEKKIAYTWAEEKVPSGYTLSGPSTEGALTTLTNTHATEKVEVGITKKWEDADNQDGKRPEDITVNLFANGKKVATQQVKANDQGEWTYMFTNLDKYYDDGKLVEYTVSEEGVKDYTLVNIPLTGETIAVDENGKVIPVNRHDTETTDVSVKKVWNDFDDKNKQRPANLTLALTANGAATDKTVVLSEGDGWQAELTGLDKYAKGEAITYSWTETDLPEGYTLSSAAQDGKVTTLTNTFTAVGKLTFTKTVSGGVSQEEADGALVFQVQKLDGEGNVVGYLDKDGILRAEETDITIKDGEFDASTGDDGILEYIKTFENIALGNYKVIETNAEIEGYRFEQDDSVTETETISVMDDSAAAKLTDVYTEIGNLTFTKTVAGGVSKEEADGALKFVVAKVDDDGKVLGYLDKDGNLVDEEVELTISNGFVTADGGKTYAKTFTGIDAGKYTVTETNAAIEGYHFNEKHSITDGKTTVSKDAAGAASLTDVYDAGTSIPLAGKKSYTDVAGNALDMPVGMFEFTLVEVDADGNALEGAAAYSQTVGNAADGSITFDKILYTEAGTHYYQVSEVNGGKTIDGVTYSDTVHDITVVVADDPDTGELVASITPEDLSLDFANGYRAADVDVVLNAQKAYVDSKTGAKQAIEDGKFEFILMRADETEGDPEVYTAKVGANGKAAFEAITFTAEMLDGAKQKTFSYDMSEVVPDTAEKVFQNGKETGWWMDNDVLYDGSTHAVEITVTDDGSGQLTATVEYDKGKAATATGPTFTNQHVSASETLKFTKYYYGGDLVDFQEFSFVLEAVKDVNEDAGTYVVRGETELDVPEGGEIADDGVRPFTIETVVAAETFHKATQADVGFPAIRFVNDGAYYYVVYEGAIDYIEELAEDEQPIAEDSAQYLIRVDVKNGKVASTKYWLLYEGDVFEVNPGSGSDELAFYNNSTGVVDFDDSGSHGYVDDGAITSVYPRAQKLVNGETLAIAKNQFTFELLDEDGTVLATSTNDDNGDVAFFDKDTQPGLEFDEPGVYTYQIREVVPPKSERLPGVTYDTSVTTLTVDVVRESMPNDTGNGTVYALEATTAYAGPNQPQDMSADYAIFNNLMEGIDVRVQKLDADTGEGLAGCEYGLWMKTSSGDVCLATAESGADGWITFEGADVLPGYQYYFKEVSAPSGYVLDPYRSDLFELSYDSASGEYSLVSAE